MAIIGNVNVDVIVGDHPPVLQPGTESMVAHGDVRPAGCVGNTALAWMAMDVPFQAIANTGDDMFGDWLRGVFHAHSRAWPRETCPTTFSVGIAHPDSERTFLTTHGHVECLSLDEVKRGLDFTVLRDGVALVVGSFLTTRLAAEYAGLFDLLADQNMEIALDTGWPIGGWTADVQTQAMSWVARCDHLLLNEVELSSLFGTADTDEALKCAAQAMPKDARVVAKRGPLGASGLSGDRFVHVSAPAVTAIDTVGAGDVFNAGYLASCAKGEPFEDAIAAGVAIASRAISTHPREYGVGSALGPRKT
ncbi:carbohydrate kinase family protein [Dongia deserti]|uniref:carbohydrate kinase family protein n=1 Tax=Dongia deserti TaxID=2268030 RepID=UPI002548FA55|nr:carbohydrate kinase family protein [Dongia deserti]